MANHKQNCWEFLNCGRQPGGHSVHTLGVCPAATDTHMDSLNAGHNGGRICWAIAGTLCQGDVQGTFAAKFKNCLDCAFFEMVQSQQERSFILVQDNMIE
jgi:hypothetical protein